MKIKVVIMSYNTPKTTKELYDLLHNVFDVTVFNVGSREGKSPVCPYDRYPNLYYTGCWREAMRRFGQYDVLWVIGGDVTAQNTALEYQHAIETSAPFGLWSPTFDGYCREIMSKTQSNGKTFNVFHLEGIALAISGNFMRQIEYDIPGGSVLGWGVDLWMSWEGWRSGSRNVLDGRVSMQHPMECGYSRVEAKREMNGFLESVIGPQWADEAKTEPEYGEFNANIREEMFVERI